jgi:hypothetical protein
LSPTITSRFVVFATAALMTVGAASGARANILFRNVTGQALHFAISCDDSSQDTWTVAPYRTLSIYCKDPEVHAATVEITTAHRHHDEVVRRTVWDGLVYNLEFDADGDVNIWRV